MRPGDYVCPDDVLIYCGTCRTPRETVVEFFADPKYRRRAPVKKCLSRFWERHLQCNQFALVSQYRQR